MGYRVIGASLYDRDLLIAQFDVNRKIGEIGEECLKVWDSMRGKIPSYQAFCQMYMNEKFSKWKEKARWN